MQSRGFQICLFRQRQAVHDGYADQLWALYSHLPGNRYAVRIKGGPLLGNFERASLCPRDCSRKQQRKNGPEIKFVGHFKIARLIE